jgi:GNAT superfamily N-acetyltransferase
MRNKFKIVIFKLINKVRLVLRGSNYFGKRLRMHLDQQSFSKVPERFLPSGYKLVSSDDSMIDELEIFYLKSDLGYCDLGYWRSYILKRGHLVVIDLKTNSIIASCFAAYSPDSSYIGRFEWFVVDKRHRGVGVGKYIAYFVTLLLSKEKFRKIELDTFEYMNSARAIYLELGWKDES